VADVRKAIGKQAGDDVTVHLEERLEGWDSAVRICPESVDFVGRPGDCSTLPLRDLAAILRP
jgi:hypothetical protein